MSFLSEIDKRYFIMSTPTEDLGTVGDSDIAKSCDICGEGRSYGRKHRLHLYIKDGYDNSSIRCFNCDYRASLYNYLKDYHTSEFELYKRESSSTSFNELKMVDIKKNKTKAVESSLDDFTDIDLDEDDSLPRLINPIKEFTDLTPEVKEYLNNRGISPLKDWRYAPKDTKFEFNNIKVTLSDFLIIPLTKGDKWLGFQALGYKEKRFFVYLLKENDGYKVWNYYNINKDEPVYIFESVFDAISSNLDNSIAQLGISLSEDLLKTLKEPVFCLDNQLSDEASLRESLKYAEQGYKVFIWPQGSEKFKDTNDLRKINVPLKDISTLIKSNIFNGMEAILKLKLL